MSQCLCDVVLKFFPPPVKMLCHWVAFVFYSEIRAQTRPETPPWPLPPSPVGESPDGNLEDRYSNLPLPPQEQQAEPHHYEALRHRRTQSNSSAGSGGSNKIYANAPSRNTTPNSPQGQLLSPSSSETYMTARSGSGSPEDSNLVPTAMTAAELGTELDLGSMVEVVGNPANCKYGVVRWLGRYKERNKPIVGLEMVSFMA